MSMHAGWAVDSRMLTAVMLFFGVCHAAQSAPASRPAVPTPSPAQMQEIQAASQPQALVDLARRFFLLRQEEASRFCIEKACLADPSLLTDGKLVSPRSWRKFWFRYRAVIRLRKLGPGDAAGRVTIAVWLHEGGERGEARRMLRAGLEIDPNLEAARTLAKAWKLDSGGPFQFDLTFGLNNPLIHESFTDEGEKIDLRPGRKFMLLPFAYDPAEGPLRILKYSVQVSQGCRVVGIVLLTTDAGAQPDAPPALRLEDQPLWERIQVERDENGVLNLVATNMIRPPGKRVSGRTRSTGDHRGGSPQPQETWRGLDQTPSGYAAFLVDVPENLNAIEAVYEDDVRVQLDMRLLEMLGRETAGMNPQGQAEFVNVLAEKVLAPNVLIASAAVAKLSQVRQALPPATPDPAAVTPSGEREESLSVHIDRILWSALGHPNPMVQRKAFAAMVEADRPMGPTLLAALRDPAQEKVALAALDQIEQMLVSAPTADRPAPGQVQPEGTVDPQSATRIKLVGLDPSPAPTNVFKVLSACLTSLQPAIVERAIEIVLVDGSEQAVQTLVDLPAGGRSILADRLPKTSDPDLKAALVRVLLLRPEPALVAKALEACRDLKIEISGPDDPILYAFRARLPALAQVDLVQMLARSDLSAIVSSDALDGVLTTLAMDAQRNPAMLAALLQLAKAAFQPSNAAPMGMIRREGAGDIKSSPFATLLARIAGTPNADVSTIRSAATTLLAAGHLLELQQKVRQMPSANERVRVISAVGSSKELWAREALPEFLAGCLGDADPKPAAAALSALAEVYKAADSSQRWRLNLAVKLGLETQALLKWTRAEDEKPARMAMSLLRQLTQMPQSDSDHFEALPEESARQHFLSELERSRSEKPVGKFACMVYIDLKPVVPGGAAAQGAPPAGQAEPQDPTIYGVPLPICTVTIQAEGEKIAHILADERYIGMPDERGSLVPAPGQLRVDAAPLLLDGLRRAFEQKQSFAGKVDRLALTDRLQCELRHYKLGTWQGEVTVGPPRTPDPLATFQVVGARVFLEPMGEQPATPGPVQVQPQ
ncbi:MAG TPA: hypothetical protein VLM89_13870 [Phycisphaerae bacterium]|nr:hypothetical protein [Phycisphaerae bacterium]